VRRSFHVCFLFGSLAVVAAMPAQQQASDPYSLKIVRNAMHSLSIGVMLPPDLKLVPRLGDGCSIAMLKIVDRRDLTDPKTVRVIVDMIHNAFARPQDITLADNRDPKVSLFLLQYLMEKVSDPELQQQIRQEMEFMKSQTDSNPAQAAPSK